MNGRHASGELWCASNIHHRAGDPFFPKREAAADMKRSVGLFFPLAEFGIANAIEGAQGEVPSVNGFPSD